MQVTQPYAQLCDKSNSFIIITIKNTFCGESNKFYDTNFKNAKLFEFQRIRSILFH